MRHAWKIVLVGIVLVFCVPFAAAKVVTGAQMHAQGRMMGGHKGRYDPATEMTLKGAVEAVTTRTHMNGMESTWLTVKTEKQTMEVRVAPAWFLEKKNMIFAKGDQVEVTGSDVTFQTREWLIAREVKKGGKTLTVRDKDGVPATSPEPRQLARMIRQRNRESQ